MHQPAALTRGPDYGHPLLHRFSARRRRAALPKAPMTQLGLCLSPSGAVDSTAAQKSTPAFEQIGGELRGELSVLSSLQYWIPEADFPEL